MFSEGKKRMQTGAAQQQRHLRPQCRKAAAAATQVAAAAACGSAAGGTAATIAEILATQKYFLPNLQYEVACLVLLELLPKVVRIHSYTPTLPFLLTHSNTHAHSCSCRTSLR